MRRFLLGLMMLSVVQLLISGCEERGSRSSSTLPAPGAAPASQAAADVNGFAEQMSHRVEAIQVRMKELRAKASAAGAQAGAKTREELDELSRKADAAHAEIAALRSKAGDAWQAAKPSVSRAVDELQAAWDKASMEFHAAPAPATAAAP